MNYISFFSGALGLDLGLELSGLKPLLYCENDKKCIETIAANRPGVPLIHDINDYTHEDITNLVKNQIDIVVGGPPCQAFSTAGKMNSLNDSRGNVFLKFLDIATSILPKYIIIENVRGLLSAKGLGGQGKALDFIVSVLEEKNYKVSYNLYNSANFGVPQIRERVIIIACLDEKVPYLTPTHSNQPHFNLKPWVTLEEAIGDLSPERNIDCGKFPEKRLKFYRMLKSGQYWKDLPVDLQVEALGKAYYLGGGKTGFIRRLSWDKPSPTLVTSPTMPATDLGHPVEDRPLSIAEYMRIQQFPDDWRVIGNIGDRYRQIGNAVPVGLGQAIGDLIRKHATNPNLIQTIEGFAHSRYKNTAY